MGMDKSELRNMEFVLTERCEQAALLAFELHREQKRKNIRAPFMCHILGVASLVVENIGMLVNTPEEAENAVMIALLHDAVEDQGGKPTLERIRQAFGDTIANGVLSLTDAIPEPGGKKLPKAERNRRYIEHLKEDSAVIALISCCDKIYNLRTMAADAVVIERQEFWKAYSQSPELTMANYRNLGTVYAEKLAGHRIVKIYELALAQVEALMP
jgi:(p)ppGpp synthase/HD superfamily hydrolase